MQHPNSGAPVICHAVMFTNKSEPMKQYLTYLIILFCLSSISAQNKDSNFKYINPFYGRGIIENYNPQTIDFSQEFYKQSLWFLLNNDKTNDVTKAISKYNMSQIWLKNSEDFDRNGIIGKDYRRIRIHFSDVKRDAKDKLIYWVRGKSKVGNNICDFNGHFRILKVLQYSESSEIPGGGEIFGKYLLNEDSSQSHSGDFKGIFNSTYNIDTAKSEIYLDESMSMADGYANNVFVGTWTDYKSGNQKKCIWSDYRLPYCFDFDDGDGEMRVNKKYEKNGWESFNNQTDFVFDENKNRYVLKDKWWED